MRRRNYPFPCPHARRLVPTTHLPPKLLEALDSIYEQWDRLAASYLFLGYAAVFILAATAVAALAMLLSR
jgi:hypothetical protein